MTQAIRSWSHSVLRGVTLLAVLPFGLGAAAVAQPMPKVDYAADWQMETADGTQQGRLFHSAGLERRELNEGGEKIIMIMRPDKKLVWNLMPSEKMYMEFAQGNDKARKDDLGQYDIEQTPAGSDTIDGRKVTKTKILMKERKPNGSRLGGFWWTTADGVMVKMDMLSIEQGSKERIKMTLSDLKIGKQDPALFEIPPGYEKMAGIGGLGKMMMGGGKDEDDDKPAGQDKKDDKKGGFGLKDALKILR